MDRTREALDRRTALSDALKRVAGGDHAALGEVYDATAAKLFGICLRILHDKGDAEDALQDVYVSVWRRADRFDPGRASPVTWLATLARNRAIDRLRARRRTGDARPVEEAHDIADDAPDALTALEAGEERERLTGCIEELELSTANAIRSAFFDGFTYAELAARMNVPLGTMKSWIRRGLMKLKECLER